MKNQKKSEKSILNSIIPISNNQPNSAFSFFIAFIFTIIMVLPLHAQHSHGWHKDRQNRIAIDFNKTHEEVKNYIKRYIPDVTDSLMEAWEQSGALETYFINGKKHYFHSAGPNLFRID